MRPCHFCKLEHVVTLTRRRRIIFTNLRCFACSMHGGTFWRLK